MGGFSRGRMREEEEEEEVVVGEVWVLKEAGRF